MAQKKPVVLNNGEFEQLQTGDYIVSTDYPQLNNANAGALVICTPVYAVSNDHVDKAKADAAGTANVIGLIADTSVASGVDGGVITNGVLSATTVQWDAVAGTTGGLTRDVLYYLSAAVAGAITSVAPSTAGQYNVCIGIAISTTEMKLVIRNKIKL